VNPARLALPGLVVALAFAAQARADPISKGSGASATWALESAWQEPVGEAPPAESGPWIRWPVVLAGVCVLAAVGLLFWSFERSARRFLKREESMRAARVKAQQMLYTDLTVDEAQRIVWAFEEMTDEERAKLSLERRVELRRISADLEAHKRRWNLG
jgi:hypothetical protein